MRTKNNHRIYKKIHRKSCRKNKRKYVVRKKQYGGTPSEFIDILNIINNDQELLNNIYKNVKMFIDALINNISDERLTGVETHSIIDIVKSNANLTSYWNVSQLMACFKNSTFNYTHTINEIFLDKFGAIFDNTKDSNGYILSDSIRLNEIIQKLGYNNQNYTTIELSFIKDNIKYFNDTSINELIREETDRTLLRKFLDGDNIIPHNKPFIFKERLGPHGKIGTPYIITHQTTKTDIIMKISNDIRLNIDVICTPENNSVCLECIRIQQNNHCFPNIQKINYIVKSSEFINETIIGYVLNTVFFPKHNNNNEHFLKNMLNGELLDDELGNSVYQIGHFQSNDNYGGNIMEKADGELDKLFKTPEFFEMIVIQNGTHEYSGNNPDHNDIIITMLLLQLSNTLKKVADELGMTHGDLKTGNVFFSIKSNYLKVNYPLSSEMTIKTNIRLKIADYGKSSIIYNHIRFYCKKPVLEKFSGLASIGDTFLLSKEHNKYEYIVDNLIDSLMSNALRHHPCPYFRSIDLYCVIISLAMQSPIFMYFYNRYDIGKLLFTEIDPLSLLSTELLANKKLVNDVMHIATLQPYANDSNLKDVIKSIQENKSTFSIHSKDPVIGPVITNLIFECIKNQIGLEAAASINIAFTKLNKKQLKCSAIESCIDKCIELFTIFDVKNNII